MATANTQASANIEPLTVKPSEIRAATGYMTSTDFARQRSLSPSRENGQNVVAQNLYDISVLIGGMSRALSVSGVTAKAAHEVANDMCAAWGRCIPDVMDDVERWTVELEETGAFEYEGGRTAIRVKRSA